MRASSGEHEPEQNMSAESEAQVGFGVSEIEDIRIAEHFFVPIRGYQHAQDGCALRLERRGSPGPPWRYVALASLRARFEAQQLLDGWLNSARDHCAAAPAVGCSVSIKRSCEEIRRGVMTRQQQQEDHAQHLVVVQPVALMARLDDREMSIVIGAARRSLTRRLTCRASCRQSAAEQELQRGAVRRLQASSSDVNSSLSAASTPDFAITASGSATRSSRRSRDRLASGDVREECIHDRCTYWSSCDTRDW